MFKFGFYGFLGLWFIKIGIWNNNDDQGLELDAYEGLQNFVDKYLMFIFPNLRFEGLWVGCISFE